MGTPPTYSRHALAEIDRLCVERYGLPSIVLMENAAIGASRLALTEFRLAPGARALIACGTGNNGGDGLAIARHLHNAGVATRIVMAGPETRLTPDAATNYRAVRAMNLSVTEGGAATCCAAVAAWRGDLLIDALLGTGLSTPVHPPLDGFIAAMNDSAAAGAPVLAVDLPSGLDCDTGEPLGVAVRATLTASFVGRKKGFGNPAAAAYTGRVVCVGIGAPRDLVDRLAEDGRD
ncbi:MAG: NAD(P)H-hydrate epimerase [Phycisphaerales bacterium]|nr:NAD(P)H-hydrate epimerase [Phycisphaerales bacterium]